jgi:hypothetical protein
MKETDIRKPDTANEYWRLSQIDADRIFSGSIREEIDCPACGACEKEYAFTKQNFDYKLCLNCETLYQSPRPPQKLFDDFYASSASSDFWSEHFFPSVVEARREKIFKPRCQKIMEQIPFSPKTIIDVGAGHGTMLEEWQKLSPEADLLAIEPGDKLSRICINKGFKTLVKTAENASELHGKADMLTCFEVIEHAYNPFEFVTALKKLVKPCKKLLVTGLCVDGFDIKVLWENNKNISPPHHINFMSIKGFKLLFERAGFTNIIVETPGKLDVDIVMNAIKDKSINHKLNLSRLERFMLTNWNETQLIALQQFLADNLLSSHCWVWADREY